MRLLFIPLALCLAACSAPAGDSQPRQASSTTTAKGGADFGLSLGLSLKALFNYNDGVAVSSGAYTFYGNSLDVTIGLPSSDKKQKR